MRRMILLLGLAGIAGLGAGLAPGIAQASVVGHVRVAINSDASFPSFSWTSDHEQMVILQSWDTADLYALKAANPSIKVLMYKNASSVSTSSAADGRYATGVSYDQAAANGWLLDDTGGSPFKFQGYDWLYAADVGQPGYQQAWVDNVLADLGSDPWDGVFIDDVNPTIRYHYCVSCVAKYPSDATYSDAMQSFVERVGPQLQAAGKLAIANIGSWSGYTQTVDPWLHYLSGAMEENFLKWGTSAGSGYADPGTWATELHELKLTQSEGKLFIGVTHSSPGDSRAALYGYATALLGGDGNAVFSLAGDYSGDSWFPEYDYDLGNPSGPEYARPDGAHERNFEHGLALVNPTLEPQLVKLDGTYWGSGIAPTSEVRIAPQSGLVLMGSASAQAADIRHDRRHRHHRRHHRRHHHRHHHRRHHRHHRLSRA